MFVRVWAIWKWCC